MFELTPIVAALAVTTAVNCIAAFVSWKRRRARYGLYFALGMTAITLWTLAAALDYAAVPLGLKIFFAKIEAAGYHSAFALFAVFAMYYAGNERWLQNKWLRAAILFIPLSNILLTLTNNLHGWVWSGFTPQPGNVYVFEYGPAFSWIIFDSYFLIFFIFLNIWSAFRKGSDFTRHQARILMFALVFPSAVNILYRLGAGGVKGVDWTSITFSISSLLILYALYGIRLLDIVPIAHDELIRNLGDAMFVLDMQNRIVDVNREAANILGLAAAALPGRELTDLIPSARAFLKQPPEREVKDEFSTGSANPRHFDALLSPVWDHAGKLIGRLLVARDITERKQNELRFLQLTQAVEQSPVSVVITDLDGRITYVNPKFLSLTGFTFEEVRGETPRVIKSGRMAPEIYVELWKTIKAGQTWRGELLNRKKNGELYWELEVIAPVLDHDGKIINFIAIKEEVTARKQAEEKLLHANEQLEEQLGEIRALQFILREQAIRDSLTGLHNRHFLNEAFGRELARAKRGGFPISFILMDIDFFKQINDAYGHAAGDLVIQYFAGILQEFTRAEDISCRYGGEEFLIVLPNTGIKSAAQIAERLRSSVEGAKIPVEEFELQITISCGVSEYPAHGETQSAVLAAADKALYAAKNGGRNKVIRWVENQTARV